MEIVSKFWSNDSGIYKGIRTFPDVIKDGAKFVKGKLIILRRSAHVGNFQDLYSLSRNVYVESINTGRIQTADIFKIK